MKAFACLAILALTACNGDTIYRDRVQLVHVGSDMVLLLASSALMPEYIIGASCAAQFRETLCERGSEHLMALLMAVPRSTT